METAQQVDNVICYAIHDYGLVERGHLWRVPIAGINWRFTAKGGECDIESYEWDDLHDAMEAVERWLSKPREDDD